MRRIAAALAAAAVSTLGIVMVAAGPASAQVPCTGLDTASPATVTPSSLLPGETLTISGGGFANSQVLGIGLFRPPVVLGTVASTTAGTYSATIRLPLETPAGQNEITVFGHGPTNDCHQSLGLFTVRELPQPQYPQYPPFPVYPPFVAPPITFVYPPVTVVTSIPAPIVVQQPLARTGSASPALVAAGLVAMLLGFHAIRVSGPRRRTAG